MVVNNNGNLLDSAGELSIDFVWGNMAPQPNDARTVRLDLTLGNHINLASGWGGFPLFVADSVGSDVAGSVDYINVPSVIGLYTESAIDALEDAGMVVTVTSPVTPALNNVALTSNVATFITSAAHGYAVGQSVDIEGLVNGGGDAAADSDLNDSYLIVSVSLGSVFTVAVTHADIVDHAVSAGTAKVIAKAGTIKTQSVGAGAASKSVGATVVIAPYFDIVWS